MRTASPTEALPNLISSATLLTKPIWTSSEVSFSILARLTVMAVVYDSGLLVIT